MSLVDDAQRIWPHTYASDTLDAGYQAFCSECDRRMDQGHGPDCPWLSMPRIVAVLKAAERLHAAVGDYPIFDDYNYVRVDIDLIEAITDAVRGDEVPA